MNYMDRFVKTILYVKGKPIISEFDKNFHTDDHDVPITCIGDQIVAIGNGWQHDLYDIKDETHLYHKLDPNKVYAVTIQELLTKDHPCNKCGGKHLVLSNSLVYCPNCDKRLIKAMKDDGMVNDK